MAVNRGSGNQPARRPLAGACEREGRLPEPPGDQPRTPPPNHRDQGPPQADPRAAPCRRGVPKLAPQLGGRGQPGREQRGGPRSTPARVEGDGTESGSGRGRPGRGGTGPEKPETKDPPSTRTTRTRAPLKQFQEQLPAEEGYQSWLLNWGAGSRQEQNRGGAPGHHQDQHPSPE
jgi:hypothetical protein